MPVTFNKDVELIGPEGTTEKAALTFEVRGKILGAKVKPAPTLTQRFKTFFGSGVYKTDEAALKSERATREQAQDTPAHLRVNTLQAAELMCKAAKEDLAIAQARLKYVQDEIAKKPVHSRALAQAESKLASAEQAVVKAISTQCSDTEIAKLRADVEEIKQNFDQLVTEYETEIGAKDQKDLDYLTAQVEKAEKEVGESEENYDQAKNVDDEISYKQQLERAQADEARAKAKKDARQKSFSASTDSPSSTSSKSSGSSSSSKYHLNCCCCFALYKTRAAKTETAKTDQVNAPTTKLTR